VQNQELCLTDGDNNWQAGQAEMNWSITRLVYENITKPLLSQYRELGYDFNLDLD
jgi:hypothetical protein